MATMTLRVGSVQSGKIHSERKEMRKVAVTKNFVDEACEIGEAEGVPLGEDVKKLASAATIDEQLIIVKEIVKKNLGKKETFEETRTSNFCTRLLVDLYLVSTPKNPMKNAIARMFLTLPESMHGDIVAYLATQLQEMMRLCRSLEEMNSAIITINCCFDNFPIGVQAVGHCFLPTLQLVETCLSSCIAELSVKLSPARRMEVCQMVHGALRAAVAVLQKYQPNIRQLLQSEVGLKEDQSLSITIHSLTALLSLDKQSTQPSEVDVCAKVSCPGVDNLTSLLELVCALMSYADLPLDTHTNCGMVLIFLRILLQGTSSKTIKKLEMPWRVDLSTDVCQLSIYCGMLNVLSASELGCLHPDTGTPLIHFIFRQLYEIGQRSTADSGMVLVVSRALLLLSRNLLNIGTVTVVEGILLEMLQFMWIHLEHYMDSVRHSAAGILHNLVKLGALLQNEGSNGCGVITTIMKEVVQIPAQKKSKYIGLAAVADEIGCQVLIDQMPHLVKDLLKALADPNLTSHVSSAVERLMLQHAGEVRDAALWRDMWVTPVLDMLAWVPPCQCGPLQAILATAVSRVPGLASHILPSSPTSTHLRTLLACFRLARRQGALDGPSRPGMWKGVVELEILEQALYHQDSEIRVSALSLLAVSHRSTEAFSPCELQLIKTYLVYNVNTEDPSSRQQTLALMKKVLTRLHGSSQVLFRKIEQGKAKKKELETDSNEAHLLKSYNTFLLWLLDFCFINLFPGANFGRRGSSLQLLTLCHEIFGFDATEPVWSPSAPMVWIQSNANILLECLKDTFENNKLMALRLLTTFPAEAIGLDVPEQATSLLEVCLQLASSCRPPDCMTAAYLLRVLIPFHNTAVALRALLPGDCGTPSSYSTVYLAVSVLVGRLSAELSEARKSLLKAASAGPMYGSLFCVRQLFSDVDWTCISHDKLWRTLMGEVVSLCFQLSEVVSPVVNSSSPEGLLPSDFQPGINLLLEDRSSLEPGVLNVTAQMLLLCSWRTVKEVSLFLGEVVEKASISSESDTSQDAEFSMLTETQVLAIGTQLATLLSETKHRGAFEQAYVGFSRLCGRLWKHPSPKLHCLPQQWLAELMNAITWGTSTKLCATRRSAGLPFMVQALVTSELQVGGNRGCFQHSMTTLLALACNTEVTDIKTDSAELPKLPAHDSQIAEEARIHALNILRSLFRHSVLGELISPYIAKGVIVALQGYKSSSWMERNAATLLFSALMTRIFGVSRSREELNIRNRMTGRIFFQRYPILYDFILRQLIQGMNEMEECHTTVRPSLFPVLLLLSRLYPSSLEGTDSNLQLGVYAPFVQRCVLNSVLKTRSLAAQALVPLIDPHQHLELIMELVSSATSVWVTENYRHGLLLQVLVLVREGISVGTVGNESAEQIEQWVVSLQFLLGSQESLHISLVTSQVYLCVLQTLAGNLFTAVRCEVWQEILDRLHLHLELLKSKEEKTDSDPSQSRSPEQPFSLIGYEMFLHSLVQLLLELSLALYTPKMPTAEWLEYMEKLVVNLLLFEKYNVANVALNFLQALLNGDGECLYEDEEELTTSLDKYFCSRVKEWDRCRGGALAAVLVTSPNMGRILTEHVVSPENDEYTEFHTRAFCVLSCCPKAFLRMKLGAEEVLRMLLQQSQQENVHESVVWPMLKCAGALMKTMIQENVPLSSEVAGEMCRVLQEFSTAEKSIMCRLTVAGVLLDNTAWLKGNLPFLSVVNVSCLWSVIMTLLVDDCTQVRELISGLATQLGCTNLPVMSQRARELLLEHFVHIMEHLDPLTCTVCLMSWCLGPVDEESDVEDMEDRVFDKGEMNIFAEPAGLSEMVCSHLKKLLAGDRGHQLLESPLPEELKDWLSGADGICFQTLAQFLDVARKGAIFSSGESSHFLFLNQKASLLTIYRTKQLMEAVYSALADVE